VSASGRLDQSKRPARAPLDASAGRRPTEQEFRAAREIVRRAGVLEVLSARVDAEVGRPRSLSVEGLLVAAQLNALRRHHQAHLVEVARVLNALSPHQLASLGVREWEPREAYDRVDRLFLKLATALQEGWKASVDGIRCRIDASWVANRLVQAAIPDALRQSASLAVDGTDVETWGALHGDAETVEVDAEEPDEVEEDVDTAPSSRRPRGPRRRARVLGIGPDGRKLYTADPDARAGHRSATNSRPAGPYVGFELHLGVQTRDVTWSDGVERVSLGQDVAPVVTNLALAPAGSHRARAVVPALVAAKEGGQAIEDVVWDPGYSLCRPETAGHPLHRAGIHQTFRPVGHQRSQKPFSADAVLLEGQLFSSALPPELAGPLSMPPRGASDQECLAYERAFNRRARYRYTRHAGPDADGATRWRCPFCAGLLRSRSLPRTMRRSRRSPLAALPEGRRMCCSGIVGASAAELPLWQRLPAGTTAWRISMGRRQVAESVNAALKGTFVDLSRKFFRVFGLAKLTLLLGFTVAGYNLDRARSFLARRDLLASENGRPVRTRARRRTGTWADLLGPEPGSRSPDELSG
jgi:hypothetical protein